MNKLLLTLALAIALPQTLPGKDADRPTSDQKPSATNLEGQWTVVYAEMDGKKMEDKAFSDVSIHNNVLTCNHGGQKRSWRLEWLPGHQVRCFEQDASTNKANPNSERKGETAREEDRRPETGTPHIHHGVYIASQEYLAFSMNKMTGDRTAPQVAPPALPTQPVRPPQTAQPAQPAQPVRPPQTAQPAQPAQPAQAAQPAQPAQPVQPGRIQAEVRPQGAMGPERTEFVLILRRGSTAGAKP